MTNCKVFIFIAPARIGKNDTYILYNLIIKHLKVLSLKVPLNVIFLLTKSTYYIIMLPEVNNFEKGENKRDFESIRRILENDVYFTKAKWQYSCYRCC